MYGPMLYQRGDRVRLIRMCDPWAQVPPGTLGTVTLTDAMGTVHVAWDDGSRLGVIEQAGDRIEPVGDERCPCGLPWSGCAGMACLDG